MSPEDPAALVQGEVLPASFFARPAELVARELLGKILVTTIGDSVTAGRIVETEAYLGADDPGSHAATRGITPRNRTMYGPPGHAYVYFTYGNHNMLNLVTCPEGTAGGVLIRAIEPLLGEDIMSRRRSGRTGADMTNGPGKVAQALGVELRHNGTRLSGEIAVHDAPAVSAEEICTSGRIGLSAGHDLQLRYYVKGSRFVSRGRTGVRPAKRGTSLEECT